MMEMKRVYFSPATESHPISLGAFLCVSSFGVQNTPIDDVDIN